MDEDLKAQTRLRIDELEDLAQRLAANPQASNFERSSWLNGIKDRCTLLKNVLGVALGNGGQTVNDPDTGTGQQLKDYIPLFDKPDDVVMREQGMDLVMVWAVKNGLTDEGIELKYPAPPESRFTDEGGTFKKWKPGDPLP